MSGGTVQKKNQIILVCGPSGVGKQTGLSAVLCGENSPKTTVSYTTRQPRTGEWDGVHYNFESVRIFREMIERDEFAEWAQVHDNYYGTTKRELIKKLNLGDVVFDLDYQGARQIKREFPEAITVLILPPKLKDLEERLRGRGDREESILRRMETAREEIRHAEWFDYWIVNRDMKVFVDEFVELIQDLRTFGSSSAIYQDMEGLKKHIANI